MIMAGMPLAMMLSNQYPKRCLNVGLFIIPRKRRIPEIIDVNRSFANRNLTIFLFLSILRKTQHDREKPENRGMERAQARFVPLSSGILSSASSD
jgi:hypothetical protein